MTLKPMSPIERAIWALTDLEKELKLIKQELYAQLPNRKLRPYKGYFTDHNGKRCWYDKRKKQEHDERKKKKKQSA